MTRLHLKGVNGLSERPRPRTVRDKEWPTSRSRGTGQAHGLDLLLECFAATSKFFPELRVAFDSDATTMLALVPVLYGDAPRRCGDNVKSEEQSVQVQRSRV